MRDLCPLLLELYRRLHQIVLVHLQPHARAPLFPEHRSLVHELWTVPTHRGLTVTTINAHRLEAMVTPRRVVTKMTALQLPVPTTSRGRRAAQTTTTMVATTDALLRRQRETTGPHRRPRVGLRTVIINPRRRLTITIDPPRRLTITTGPLRRLTITTDPHRRPTIIASAHPSRAAAVPLRHQMPAAVRHSRAAAPMVRLAVVLLRPRAAKAQPQGRARARAAAMAPPAPLLKAQRAAALALATRAVAALARAAATLAAAAPVATIAPPPRRLIPVAQRQARTETPAAHQAVLLRRHRQMFS